MGLLWLDRDIVWLEDGTSISEFGYSIYLMNILKNILYSLLFVSAHVPGWGE